MTDTGKTLTTINFSSSGRIPEYDPIKKDTPMEVSLEVGKTYVAVICETKLHSYIGITHSYAGIIAISSIETNATDNVKVYITNIGKEVIRIRSYHKIFDIEESRPLSVIYSISKSNTTAILWVASCAALAIAYIATSRPNSS